MPVLWKQ